MRHHFAIRVGHVKPLTVAASLLAILSTEADLVISEFLADNDSGQVDAFGENSDWIEIWNDGPEAVSTGGWFLSDDPDEPTLWPLPVLTVEPNGYAVIHASGRDLSDPLNELHANFKLSRSTPSNVLLSRLEEDASITIVSSFSPYPDQFEDVSYGLTQQNGSGESGYFSLPTPGSANAGASVLGFVSDTKFSTDRGFYDDPIEVIVTTETPGATLIYTLDGSWPSETNGIQVPSPNQDEPPSLTVPVSATSCLRAMATKSGFEPTNVDSHTYIFPDQVLQQDGIGAPFDQAVDWGWVGPDWEMDPEIVNHRDPQIKPVADDLKRIPTVSISMNFEEMFGSEGIYIAGQSVEKNVSIELLNPENNILAPNEAEGFQVDGTVQIVGGTSPQRWKVDHLSMRLKFDRDLRYPVFGDEATDRFDTLVLDAHLGDVWHYGGTSNPETQRGRAQYARDQFVADMHREIGGYSPHGRTVLVYINGIFWGMHTLHERPDDNFAASYMGGDNEDYNVVKHNIDTAVSGNLDSYEQLHALADRDLSIQENFDEVAALLDIDAFIDYIALNYFLGNTDWGHQNWYASRNQSIPGGKWQFHSWDAENVMNFLTDDASSRNNPGGPTNLQHDLSANEGYRLRFADRIHQHFHNGGAMTPARASELYLQRTLPINLAIRLESARWGDNHRSIPYTRLDWLDDRNAILGDNPGGDPAFRDYFTLRPNIVLNQLRNRGWYPNTEPPDFSTHGGRVPSGFNLAIDSSSAGAIYYTTDGSDPRIPTAGEVTDTTTLIDELAVKRAIMPTNGSLSSSWVQPGFDHSSWPSGVLGAGYENSSNGRYVDLIDDNLDFAGQVNNSNNESIYMRTEFTAAAASGINRLRLGLRYDDGFIAYLNGVEVARANAPGFSGQPAAWDAEATASHDDSDAVNFATFDISDHADLLLEGANVLAIHALNFRPTSSDFLIWPTLEGAVIEGGSANGVAETAILYDEAIALNQSTTIHARVLNQGEWSPLTAAAFVVDAVAPTPANLVISKIHYHPSNPTLDEINAGFANDGAFEYIELMNVSDETVDLSGVGFSDGIEFSFDNSDTRLLPPQSRTLIVRDLAAFEFRYGSGLPVAGVVENDTALSNSGENLTLVDQEGSPIQQFEFLDEVPWPTIPDGGGPALVLVDPLSAPDHSLAESWTASVSNGGNPGLAENDDPLRALLAEYFDPSEMTDETIIGLEQDPDGDKRATILELFFGSDPTVPTTEFPGFNIEMSSGGQAQLKIVCRNDLAGIDWFIEESIDLIKWSDASSSLSSVFESDSPELGYDTITLTEGEEIPYQAAKSYRIHLTAPN